MGLFSLFKKPDQARPDEAPDPLSDDAAARLAANSETARQHQQARQREIARATAMKIDAIESAMAFDIFNEPEPAWGSQRQRPSRAGGAAGDGPDTEALADLPTTLLLRDDDLPEAAVAAQSAPVVEEIAILYANGQSAAAAQMLTDSVGASQDRTVWWMLFDLYQVGGQRERFDNLSIDYVSTFETSPPSWNAPADLAAASPGWAGVTPTTTFSGVLGEDIAGQLEDLLRLADAHPVLRLEFHRVTDIEAPACWLLLDTLRRLQALQRELILAGAAELAAQIRAGIAIGRPDDTEGPWLLLLELLQLLNREKEFEETGMDYCVTFEVSPPSFVAPHKVAMAPAQRLPASPDRFMLPSVMENQLGPLLPAIEHYAGQYQTIVFDCSRLLRIDYPAAIGLHACLQPLAAEGRKIEFRDVNHLVTALLRLLGYGDIARLYPHKY
ncbi:STAS domain-containing protein [Oxalobacteraceae bacterium OTU3REALA1]|nr:STAS domain-containing protein [Oxalobacteraceae bacterium OTU3REALA1]